MLSTKLFLREPEELEAFARFCTDMANVQRKQRGRLENPTTSECEPNDDSPNAPVVLSNPGPMTAYEQALNRTPRPHDPLLPPPHDSLEEAQRAAAVNASMLHTPAQDPYLAGITARSSAGTVPNSAPEGLHAIAPPVPSLAGIVPTSVGFDTQALADDAAKLFGLGVNPMTGQPVGATSPAVPLPPPVAAPSTAAVDQFLTAPAAPPAGQVLAFPLPVPPSAPSVAAPTAAGTTSPAGGVDLDADGLPWDHRIHSSSKEKNKDGRWRSKRGLNDEGLVKRIEAELRATMAIPAPLPVPPVVAPPATPGLPVTLAQIPAPPTAIPLPPPAAAATSDPTDFASLIAVLTPRLTPDRMPKIFEIVQSFGLPGLPALQQRPDLVPAVWAKLKEHLG